MRKAYHPLTAAIVLMMVGLVIRFWAEFLPEVYFTHLAYAGIFWAAGVGIWAFSVLSKIFI